MVCVKCHYHHSEFFILFLGVPNKSPHTFPKTPRLTPSSLTAVRLTSHLLLKLCPVPQKIMA